MAAFLDLDTRQRFVAESIRAVAELDPRSSLIRAWDRVQQQCYAATTDYVTVSQDHDLDAPAVDLFAATTALQRAHTGLGDAAAAVDTFYQRHRTELDHARAAVAATPRIAEEAAAEAARARALLQQATPVHGFRSVRAVSADLTEAVAALDAALATASALGVRAAATRLHGVASEVEAVVRSARTAGDRAATTLSSVRTRMATVQTRLERMPEVRSALLREFSEPNSRDLVGNVDRAVAELARGRADWESAAVAVREGRPEDALESLKQARLHLADAADSCDALTDRLDRLRAVHADPSGAEREVRFRIRDAQRLVVDRGKVAEWGSVLDAQARRVEVARSGLTGAHPNYWAYVSELTSVTAFVRNVVDRVRGEVERHG